MRSEDGRFAAGASGNPGGRPRVVQQARDLIEALAPELVMTLMEIVRDRKVPARARVAAAMGLLDRRYGRPKQQVKWADGLILPLPDDEEHGDQERGDEEPEEPCPPEQPAESAADDAPDPGAPDPDAPDLDADADAAPDRGEPAAEPVAAVTGDAAAKQPGRPDEAPPPPSNEPAPSYVGAGEPWRFGMDWPCRPTRPPLPHPCSEAPPSPGGVVVNSCSQVRP